MNMKNYSNKAQIVLNSLTNEEKEAVKKDYPIKSRRDEIVRTLRKKDIQGKIISEISGLSCTSVYRIEKRIPLLNYSSIFYAIECIRESLDSLDNYVKEIAAKQ